jgi:hypothetical protein
MAVIAQSTVSFKLVLIEVRSLPNSLYTDAMRFIVPSLLAYATSVTAVGIAVVLNNSTDPIYVWSVGGSVGPRYGIKSGESISDHATL